MVLTAGALAGRVGATVGDALAAPFGADEVGQGQGVFGEVGRDAVGADAGVGQGCSVAAIGYGLVGVGGGLQTDTTWKEGMVSRARVGGSGGRDSQRTGGLLLVTPCLSGGVGYGVRVNRIFAIGLGGHEGGEEGGSGREGDDGLHGKGGYCWRRQVSDELRAKGLQEIPFGCWKASVSSSNGCRRPGKQRREVEWRTRSKASGRFWEAGEEKGNEEEKRRQE